MSVPLTMEDVNIIALILMAVMSVHVMKGINCPMTDTHAKVCIIRKQFMTFYYPNFFRFLDINECSSGNGGCGQSCVNQLGSYKCGCGSGYLLSSDAHICNGTCLHVYLLVH